MSEINLCIVAGTHGDEYPFGKFIQNYVQAEMPNTATMLKGNPLAIIYGRRFVYSDLNRVFDGSGSGYEAERTDEIREIYQRNGFTHVIDLHTSPTTHSVVPIVPGECDGPENDRVINAIPSVNEIVKLPKSDKPSSLVGAFGPGGMGLECPRYYAEKEFAGYIGQSIVGFLQGQDNPKQMRAIYAMKRLIPMEVDLNGDQLDFTYSPELQGDLFVAAPSIYKGYPGYNAQGMVVDIEARREI